MYTGGKYMQKQLHKSNAFCIKCHFHICFHEVAICLLFKGWLLLDHQFSIEMANKFNEILIVTNISPKFVQPVLEQTKFLNWNVKFLETIEPWNLSKISLAICRTRVIL